MALTDRHWVLFIKSSSRAYDDFLVWINEERSKIQALYKLAPDQSAFKELVGREKSLDNLIALFTMADREERQRLEYERSQNGK